MNGGGGWELFSATCDVAEYLCRYQVGVVG